MEDKIIVGNVVAFDRDRENLNLSRLPLYRVIGSNRRNGLVKLKRGNEVTTANRNDLTKINLNPFVRP